MGIHSGLIAYMKDRSFTTVIEALASSLEAASAYNSNDMEKPAAVLWADHDSRWQPIVPQLRRLMPQLLTLGEYRSEDRTGPSVWLRCVIGRALEAPEVPAEMTPVVYLPGVGRQELGAAETCPDHLKPLVELQYRGACWAQKNGRDWTVEAFLVSGDGGLGLDVARDTATRQSMLRSLKELATTSVQALMGKRLEAEDFDRLFSDDPVRDVLFWLSDSEEVQTCWDTERWNAFTSRCKADLELDPEQDGEIVAAERLGKREGAWESVWQRFAESPALYSGLPELLRKAKPNDLFVKPASSWPQDNESDEARLRRALHGLGSKPPPVARKEIIELEKTHGERRDWVWAKLDQAPLAYALARLAALAARASSELGGASIAEMAKLYTDGAWQIDAEALDSMAKLKSSVDTQAVSKALNAIYRPWLESAARRFQELAEKEPLPGRDKQDMNDVRVEPGTVILFADGLRFDVSRRLAKQLRTKGRSVSVSTRWAGLPTVTATAKPAVSPVTDGIKGASLGEDFLPVATDTELPLTTNRFRKLLAAAGYQYVGADETGDPSGRAWTENGELDKLGHSLQGKLAAQIEEQVDLLLERIEALLDSGWDEVRVVTDHGWLWLPGGLPKVDLPKYLTKSRWARCAAIEGESNVEAPTVPWHWNTHERVAIGPGIACFGAGNEYAHGGLSLQESLVPVIRVTPGADSAKVKTSIINVSWIGLRCRVRIDVVRPGLSIDLRTQVNDANSSVSGTRPVDDEGRSSLLIADDGHEGAPAAVVILDADGQVIARQSTIIGGED